MRLGQDRKPQSHLVNILKTTADHHPNFALFLGAGASVASGVKNASEMVEEWRRCCHQTYDPAREIEEFLGEQPWHKQPDEYSVLFELLYDQPSQRREYIETCMKTCAPSWGYIYLVNLLRKHVFDTVFTTNFDDLLNEACYQFSDSVRPIVCAHDSSIRSVRITSKRPKIIKLHGDFLFDNIKNTVSELEALEDNMREKFRQFAGEYGLIVIGYSGNDRSIMDTLNALLKSETNFPHGVYWCVRKGSTVGRNVTNLARFPKVTLVEIDGFDEFFASVHEALGLELQPEMSDPYGSLVKRLNSLLVRTRVPSPEPGSPATTIQRDIERIAHKVGEFSSRFAQGREAIEATDEVPRFKSEIASEVPIPYQMLAEVRDRAGDADQALRYFIQELRVRPNVRTFERAFTLMCGKGLLSHSGELMQSLRDSKDVLVRDPGFAFNIALPLIDAGQYELADEVLDLGKDAAQRSENTAPHFESYYTLNKLQIKARQGALLSAGEQAMLQYVYESGGALEKMGAAILLKNYDDAQTRALEAIEKGLVEPGYLFTWPIMRLLTPQLTNPALKAHLLASGVQPTQQFGSADRILQELSGRAATVNGNQADGLVTLTTTAEGLGDSGVDE